MISLGDTNSYFLSCAENELGVVIAYSEAGNSYYLKDLILFFILNINSGARMIPISWNEMQCPNTLQKEFRKVAKVQPDFINYVEPKELTEDKLSE